MSLSKSSPVPSGAVTDADRKPPSEKVITLCTLSRPGWRCLRQLLAFRDFSHLARRLHVTHSELQSVLLNLSTQLGDEHLRLLDGRIHLSEALERAIQACAENPQAAPLPRSPRSAAQNPALPDRPTT